MRRSILMLALVAAALWSLPALAQSRSQLGPLCTSDNTPADQQIDACNKILALKVFSGEKLATIYFWRAVGWNKKGDYSKVIADTTEALRLKPEPALYNMRGSAYYDKGEYDIAIADFNDALRIGPPSGTIFHNRGNAWRSKGDYARAIADYDEAIRLAPKEAYSYQNRGVGKTGARRSRWRTRRYQRRDPAQPGSALRADQPRGDLARQRRHRPRHRRRQRSDPARQGQRAGQHHDAAGQRPDIGLHPARARLRGKGRHVRARQDFKAALEGAAVDAGSKANQATAKVRLSLLSDAVAPSSRVPRAAAPAPFAREKSAAPEPAPPPASAAADALAVGQRVALVIGNGAYASVKALPNPPNDARAIAKNLRDIGFTVSEGVDLDRATMQKMTRDFLREAARAQIAVIYYAGHGLQIDGRNYLVPVDARLQAGGNLTEAMIDMDTILAGLDDQVRTNILIFDACRNNPMAPRTASAVPERSIEAGSGLAAPTAPNSATTLGAGTLIAFATAPGQVALDGEGGNSPFSAALSRHIGTPGLEVQQMLTRVRAEVVGATRGKQVPWSNSSLLGEVYLAAKP